MPGKPKPPKAPSLAAPQPGLPRPTPAPLKSLRPGSADARWQRTVRYGWDKGGSKGGR